MCFTAAAPAVGQSVWELTPYRIRLLVAFAPEPELTPRLQSDFMIDLVDRTDALVGAAWDVTVEPAAPALQRAMRSAIDSVSLESLGQSADGCDKVMLLVVGRGDGGHRVAVRELDVRTRVWGPVVSRRARRLGTLCDVALRAMFEAFAPLALIARVEGGEASLRLRAAALGGAEASPVAVRPGDAFRAVIRHNHRDGTPRRITAIAWTYLSVERVSADEVACRVISGLRSPLGGRRRGRVEPLALAVVSPHKASTLILQSRSGEKQPLPGYDVYAHPPDSTAATLIGRTDWRGRVVVPPAGNVLRVLLVKSGGELLARLPMVPGLQPTFVAQIANDDGRLEAEGFITGLQEELVDLVTRRELLLARAKARILAKKYDKARELIDELRRLPTGAEFSRTLSAQRAKTRSDDPTTRAKIDALFGDTQKLVDQHLRGDDIEPLQEQLRKARKPTKDNDAVRRTKSPG